MCELVDVRQSDERTEIFLGGSVVHRNSCNNCQGLLWEAAKNRSFFSGPATKRGVGRAWPLRKNTFFEAPQKIRKILWPLSRVTKKISFLWHSLVVQSVFFLADTKLQLIKKNTNRKEKKKENTILNNLVFYPHFTGCKTIKPLTQLYIQQEIVRSWNKPCY